MTFLPSNCMPVFQICILFVCVFQHHLVRHLRDPFCDNGKLRPGRKRKPGPVTNHSRIKRVKDTPVRL
jgi:hypothetical protein